MGRGPGLRRPIANRRGGSFGTLEQPAAEETLGDWRLAPPGVRCGERA